MILRTAAMFALSVVAAWMVSPSVRATEISAPGQGGDTQIGPSTDIKKTVSTSRHLDSATSLSSQNSREMPSVP